MIIDSKIELGPVLGDFKEEIIKNEPMFFNSSFDFAYENGGEPTKQFLEAISKVVDKDKIIIDSRVHMLMKGWYPCIPGYHHDDVPRERKDGQPEYYKPSYRSKHALVLYNAEVCPTQFALGNNVFSNPEDHKIIYKEWHKEVQRLIDHNQLYVFNAPNNQIVFFDDRTWHQGTAAIKNGWRLFIRASWQTDRKPTNEIRRQVQVYLENPFKGW